MFDWLATRPEYGAGLLLTQFQESPPSAFATAPAGNESSTHTIVFESGLFVVVETGGVVSAITDALPASSQVARPSNWLKDMPLTVLPSKSTWLAGTSRRTHWPAAGSGPM